MIEKIHPHNDALLLIDNKVKNLLKTLEHIKSYYSGDSKNDYQEIKTRLKMLEGSKQFLLSAGEFVTESDYEKEYENFLARNEENVNAVDNKRKTVKAIGSDGFEKEYSSIYKCANDLNISSTAISRYLNGIVKDNRNGYIFKRL